jgi:hypothetical protein
MSGAALDVNVSLRGLKPKKLGELVRAAKLNGKKIPSGAWFGVGSEPSIREGCARGFVFRYS